MFKRPAFLIITTIAALLLFVAVGFFAQSRFNPIPQIVASTTASTEKKSFPSIPTDALSSDQQKIITILKQEYETQPNGTKYSEGIEEPWCADFVSWVYNQAGVPLKNPNSGSWRIPGTYTLREYYEAEGKFQPASTGYVPKVGDIMLYDNPSPFGQHTNFVIAVNDGTITTIGGNEPGGIRIVEHTNPDTVGFLGFGVL